MTDRNFKNPYPDYGEFQHKHGKFDVEKHNAKVNEGLEKLLRVEEKHWESNTDPNDTSVYTGTTGVALMYFNLFNRMGDSQYLEKAAAILENQPSLELRKRDFTFLCGDAGPLALGAVIYTKQGDTRKAAKYIESLLSFGTHVGQLSDRTPDEFLYGRCGYLYALRFVQKFTAADADPNINNLIRKIIDSIFASGKHLAQEQRFPCPLMYRWHDSYYLGGAHGISGILYMLLQLREYLSVYELNDLIRPTIDYLITLRYPSGNYPSSLGSKSDRLVHWCHGAPGFIHMFLIAYEVFKDERYLHEALTCSDVIWQRGLLRKGYGICHGPSGNAYGFLRAYQTTGDAKQLYRAHRFADWCMDFGSHGCSTPDRPYSLFEGLAGVVYFLADLPQPEHAVFPAFQL